MCNTADKIVGLDNNAEVVRLRMGSHIEWPGSPILVIRAKRRIMPGEEILISYNRPTLLFQGTPQPLLTSVSSVPSSPSALYLVLSELID